MEKVHCEQVEFILTIRRRRRRRASAASVPIDSSAGDSAENSAAHFTSQHLLSICFGAYIIVGAVLCPPISKTVGFDHYCEQPLLLNLFSEEKLISPKFSPYTFEMHNEYFCNVENFKSRPIRIRYRNDQFLLPSYECSPSFCSNPVVRPLLVEDHNYAWSQGPSSSSFAVPLASSESASHNWDQELCEQKNNCFPLVEDEFYGPNLTSIIEKNVHEPLSSSEVAVYQNSAKDFYAGYLSQTERHRCCSANLLNPVEESSDSWMTTSQNRYFNEKDNSSISNNTTARISYNATFLESDNPVLHDVSLSQSASLAQTGEQDENIVESTSSLSPTLTLSDTEFNQFCADEQVKEDIADAVFEQLNNTSSVGDYFRDCEFGRVPNLFQQGTNSYGSLSSAQTSSTSSNSGSSDYSFDSESSSKVSMPSASTKLKETSRDYGKLFPEVNEDVLKPVSGFRNEQKSTQKNLNFTEKTMKMVHGRRGRRSKDEILVMKFNLPATAAAISEMSLSELQKLSRSLNDEQRAVMKKIRRRGKNKVAARMCRQRKIVAPISLISCKGTTIS
uniref:BZIP_Maf domain-containing protein n=1 Tax=Syphacia muris TaxID=451379 RepID=A0A0N5APY1_9BILA